MLVTASSSVELVSVTSSDMLLFHSVIKKQSPNKTEMGTSLLERQPEGAESLVRSLSGGGEGVGRRAGPGRPAEVSLRPA